MLWTIADLDPCDLRALRNVDHLDVSSSSALAYTIRPSGLNTGAPGLADTFTAKAT